MRMSSTMSKLGSKYSSGIIVMLLMFIISVGWAQTNGVDSIRSLTDTLLKKRQRLDQTIWASESIAQQYEARFTQL